MNNNKNIGVIGAGSMGMAIALNLQDKGYQVAIRDIRSDIETTARHSGLTVCSSPAAIAAHADFIIIMVVIIIIIMIGCCIFLSVYFLMNLLAQPEFGCSYLRHRFSIRIGIIKY